MTFERVKKSLCGWGAALTHPQLLRSLVLQTNTLNRMPFCPSRRRVSTTWCKLSGREGKHHGEGALGYQARGSDAIHTYLLGHSFTLCSDHAPLKLLHRMKETYARITHWYLTVQLFKIKVIHRLGAQAAVADFLLARARAWGLEGIGIGDPALGAGDMWFEGGVAWCQAEKRGGGANSWDTRSCGWCA